MTITAISTEGRVFVAQLTRDVIANERTSANLMAPGAKCWHDAFKGLNKTLATANGPRGAATVVRDFIKRAQAAQQQGSCFVNFYYVTKRAAAFEILTWEVDKHPLLNGGQEKEGLLVKSYFCLLRRNGYACFGCRAVLAYISWHALARLHERGAVDILDAKGLVAGCGLVGLLMRDSPDHVDSELNYAVANILCTGVMRTKRNEEDKRKYAFFDVQTVLPLDDVSPAKREQGIKLGWTVNEYLEATTADPWSYAESVAVLPFHSRDFVSKTLESQS